MTSNSKLLDSERLHFATEHSAIWLVAVVGLSLSLAALWLIRHQLAANQLLDFEWVAHNRIRALDHGIESGLLAVTMVRDFYTASENVDPEEFSRFSESLLERYEGIERLAWISRTDISVGEHPQSSPVPLETPYQFTLQSDSGQAYHFALANMAPDGTEHHSFADNPLFISMLQQSMDSGKIAASGRIEFQKGKDVEYGFMASFPVYRVHSPTNSSIDHQNHLTGFAVGLFRISELTDESISLLEPRGVEILLLDGSAEPDQRYLHFYQSRLAPSSTGQTSYIDWLEREDEPKVIEEIGVADRTWQVICGQTDSFRSAETFQESPWVALISGLLFTILMSFYLVRIRENADERLSMQMQLIEREELFRQMTETVDEVFWAMSPDSSRLLYLSPAYERIFGTLPSHGVEQDINIFDAIPPPDNQKLVAALRKIRVEQVRTELIHRVNRADETTRWVRTQGVPVKDDQGRIQRIVGFIEDITEKKLADEALRESEANLRDMFQQSPDIIMTVNKKGKILLMNRSIPDLPAERAVGRNSLALMPHEFRKWFRRALKKVFRKGVTRQFEYSANDGIFWQGRIVPIHAGGPVTAAMVIATDVTEKRNLELQAQRSARLASIGVLSAGVAHEINNPNNAIQFNASLVSRAWTDLQPILREYYEEHGDFALAGLAYSNTQDTFPRLLSEITKNSERITRIVKNLKHMARQDTGSLSEKVDIQQVLEATLMILHNQIQKYTDQCSLNVPDGLPLIKGNSQQLEQVFINTLLNALQALPDRTKGIFITAQLSQDEQSLEIAIRDEGRGISKRDLGRLTEPFFTTRPESGGTGLGLSISRSIIEKHRGSLLFESELGRGTTVTIRIPIDA